MAYTAPQTADFHLKMAYDYLEMLRVASETEGDAPPDITDYEKERFTKAAQHLNAARKIDPNAVLERIDYSDGEPVTLHHTVDQMSAQVLFYEGLAYHNCARAHMLEDKPRKLRAGKQLLVKARDTYLRALKYAPGDDNIREQLREAYRQLGDKENLRKLFEEDVRDNPDNMWAHRELADIQNKGLKEDTMFSWFQMLPIRPMTMIVIALMIIGSLIANTAPRLPNGRDSGQALIGMAIVFIPAGFWIWRKWCQFRDRWTA